MKSDKPIIVSMGEPSGISSEIIIKVWLKRDLYKIPPFILVDDLKKLNQVKSFFNLKKPMFESGLFIHMCSNLSIKHLS